MLNIALKNVLKKKVLYLCLAVGFILSIAIVCAVPVYVNSVLNSYISNTFIEAEGKTPAEDEKYLYPSAAYLTQSYSNYITFEIFQRDYSSMKSMFLTESRKLPVEALSEKVALSCDNIRYPYTKDNKSYESIKNRFMGIDDFNKHVNIVMGRMTKGYAADENAAEVIVDKRTFDNYSLQLDKDYDMVNVGKQEHPKMRVVGVYEIKDKQDPYWYDKDTSFYCSFITTENGFLNTFEKNDDLGRYISNFTLETIYDYHKINSTNAKEIYKIGAENEDSFIKRTGNSVRYTISNNLKPYMDNSSLYSTVMWIFLVPVLLVVLYYIWMISELIADSDKEQIAVLKSRGASQFQILKQYLYEGLILSFIGLTTGPVLGMLLCKLMSFSDGFLVFDSKQGIHITFTTKIYLYAIAAVAILLGTLLASVFYAAQKSIVEVKHSKNRYYKVLFKNKYMDLILLGIALYGYYNFNIGNNVPALTGAKVDKAPMDPLLYLVSTVFIIGFGMFMLRIYRYVIRLIFEAGKTKYFTSLYISIINVMRYHLKKSTALLFVVITVALGVFNIHMAKDINTSYINTVKYTTGTDMIIKGTWSTVSDEEDEAKAAASFPIKPPSSNSPKTGTGSKAGTNSKASTSSETTVTTYIEPSFKEYFKIDGIDKLTKVYREDAVDVSLGNNVSSPSALMGIIPHEFGTIASFDGNLTKNHWYNYLNTMTLKPNSVLISSALSRYAGIKPGDTIYYKVSGALRIKGVVCDVVDYWPGCSDLQNKRLVIGNFNYMFSSMPIKPYEIWMKAKPEASSDLIYNSIRSNNIPISYLKDLSVETFNAKSDIYLKGTNSALNLGFLSVVAITILGFLVYWILSLKTRTLSFGVYRSLGLSSKGVTLTLIMEQLLTLGFSIFIGVLTGNTAGSMFIPLIKSMWYENRYVIPAQNLTYFKEYLQLGAVIALIFIASFVVLARYIKRLKVNQAIKLGED